MTSVDNSPMTRDKEVTNATRRQQEAEDSDLSETSFSSKDVSWYLPPPKELEEPIRSILNKYSGIPSDQVLSHVLQLREQAWKIFPYPCIGLLQFLSPNITLQTRYPEVLQRLQAGQKYLDLGCGFAQDLRKLVFDGAPAENLYGADQSNNFIDLGYELFLDRETLKSRFLIADIFAPDSDLQLIDNSIDVIHAWTFFHLFDWNGQVAAGKRAIKLLRPIKGSIILGGQVGHEKPGLYQGRATQAGNTMWFHTPATLEKLWQEIGEATGTSWKVEASTEPLGIPALLQQDAGLKRIMFAIERQDGADPGTND